jgi:hypothetical protein
MSVQVGGGSHALTRRPSLRSEAVLRAVAPQAEHLTMVRRLLLQPQSQRLPQRFRP